jgi:hypothetical protein
MFTAYLLSAQGFDDRDKPQQVTTNRDPTPTSTTAPISSPQKLDPLQELQCVTSAG